MKDVRSAALFLSYRGGAIPVNSSSVSWNVDLITTTASLIIDLLENLHLEGW